MKALNAPGMVPLEYRRPEWASCVVPYRPWWHKEWATYVERCDGKQIRTGHKTRAEIAADCAKYDEQNPLPFPGLRAGQIWAVSYLQTTAVIGPLTGTGIIARFDGDVFEREAMNLLQAVFQCMPATFSPGSPGPIWGIVLLHDPCRPDLAPWTGACPP